jgi:hypothetical protein
MSRRDFDSEEIKTESSWAGLARIIFITLILAGGFLYYYFGPRVQDLQGNSPKASVSHKPITLVVGGNTLSIPENYTVFGKARRGGDQGEVELYASLPNFEGYSLPHQYEFEGNDSNSPVIHFSLYDPITIGKRIQPNPPRDHMSERQKFEQVFLPYVTNRKGRPWRYGLVHYNLAKNWGQTDEDLFVHEGADGSFVMFRCIRKTANMPSPWCRRDIYLSDTLGLSYRFKRERLDDWRRIDGGIKKLVDRFVVKAVPDQTQPAS